MYHWLILADDLNITLSTIGEKSFDLSTDLAVAIPDQNLTGYLLYDVYNPSRERGLKINVTYLGYWNENEKMQISLTQEKVRRRSNLHKLFLRAGFVVSFAS